MSYGDQGRLAVGFSSSLTGGNLRATIADYLQKFPEVQFDGVEAEPERLRKALQLRLLDVAITAADISEEGIVRAPLWPERIMVVLPENHPLVEAELVYWSDLKREVIVMPRNGTGANLSVMLTAKLTSQNLRPIRIIHGTSYDTIINMVNVGRFITIAPEGMQAANRQNLIFRDLHSSAGQTYLDFFAFWRDYNENPALKYFIKLLKERYPSISLG